MENVKADAIFVVTHAVVIAHEIEHELNRVDVERAAESSSVGAHGHRATGFPGTLCHLTATHVAPPCPCFTEGPDTAIGDDASWQPVVKTAIKAAPSAGPPGSTVNLTLSGYGAGDTITLRLLDGGTTTTLKTITADNAGHAMTAVTIPTCAAAGAASITGNATPSGRTAAAKYTIKAS